MVLFSQSCSKTNVTDTYHLDNNGIYYELLSIGNGKKKPSTKDVLLIQAELKTQLDSIFLNTENNTREGLIIFLNNDLVKRYFNPYFLKLVEGDSASFLIPKSLFFQTFFDTLVPTFLKNDSLVKFNFKIKSLQNISSYSKSENNVKHNELQELKKINYYLKNNYPNVVADKFGIYVLEIKENKNQKVKLGKKVKVSYQGFFLDGKPLDFKPQQIEFIYGTPDQFIKGLNIVIGSLKKGEFSKIILPSRLAFGELGSSNKFIQPYTPLVYNITLIDIK